MHSLDEPFPVPAYPPRDWFEGPPEWVAPWRAAAGLAPASEGGILRLTVTDEGRIGGWFFNAGQCLVHDANACPKASPTRYAAFHQSDVLCSDGTMLDCGVIGMTHGHQSPWLDWKEAQRLYADPTAQKILCCAGDDQRGGWIAGAVVPGTTYGDVALMRRSGLSGDWRPMPAAWWTDHGITASVVRDAEGYDCIGPTLVTRPALPLTRNFSYDGRAAAILGGSAGIELDVSRFSRIDRERIVVLASAEPLLAAPQGNPEALRQWYNDGADGQINWGEHGDFDACVAIASNHMDAEQAKGFCAERHNDVTGEYPGKAAHGAASRFTRRAYFDETKHPRADKGRFTYTDQNPGGVVPRTHQRLDITQQQRDAQKRQETLNSIGKFDFGLGDTGPPGRVTPVTLPNRVSLYPDNVQALIDANPRMSGEDDFAYQGRIVAQLDPESQSDVIYAMRETYEPVPFLADAMNQWASDHGLAEPPPDLNQVPVDIEEADRVARFFEDAPDQSGDPQVRAAYEDFKQQNEEMFSWMTRPEVDGGLGVTVDFTPQTDPYPTAAAQADDLRDNHHITIESGLGGDHTGTMTQDEYDRFRAVHDVFGHAAVGGGFDRHGEYEAWLAHSAMYTPPGRDAMSTEYHGVNSALWTGQPGTPGTGKSVLLPEEFSIPPWERGTADTGPATTRTSALAPDKQVVVQKLIDALDLKPGFAQQFDHPTWHVAEPTPVQAASRFDRPPPRFVRRAYTYDESKHPRGEGGRFTFGNGPDPTDTAAKRADGGGAALADRLIHGEKGLVLPTEDVASFTDRIAQFGQQEKAKGENSRLNLCEVSVPGTNLFCGDNQGIPRKDMPQLKGEVRPGSPAAANADSTGHADITGGFVDLLRSKGVGLSQDQVKSESLKSTQKELVGEKVAGIAQGIRDGKVDITGGDRILVSKDNYILDGHHRWAGAILNDAEDGHLGDSTMPITRVDMGILDLVKEANAYANQQGIIQQSASQQAALHAAASDGSPGDRLRAIAQRMAIGQHKLHEKPGPIMSALMSAAAHIDRGNNDKAKPRLDEAIKIASDLEDRHHKDLAGLTDEIRGIADEVFTMNGGGRVAATKAEGGKNFGPSDYAYVPDSSMPSTWKLRLTATPGGAPDPATVGAAAAALGAGFRGNKVELPTAARAEVVAKVRSAWKRANPEKKDDEMPEVLQTSTRSASSGATVDGVDTRTILILDDGTRFDSSTTPGIRVASVALVASVVAAGDLPVAPPDTPWDENTAKQNLAAAATGPDGTVDLAAYGKAFLFHDDTQADAGVDSYYWPIADVVDGTVTVVPAAVDAAMAAVNDGTIGTLTPQEKDATTAILTAYAPAPASDAMQAEMEPVTREELEVMREELGAQRARVNAHDEFMDDYLSAKIASILASEKPFPIAEEPPLPVLT